MLHYKSCAWNGPLRRRRREGRRRRRRPTPGHTVHSGLIPLGLAKLADTFIDIKIAFCVVNICLVAVFSQDVPFLLSSTDGNTFDLENGPVFPG
jgi:hypothetical protein